MTQKYQVKVSMKQAAIVETGIVLKQGDFGMQLEIEVLDFDATGTTPQIVFRKAMGAVESTTITVSGNKYTYTFKGTELDTPGKCFCDLKLKNSTTQRISTASFMFKVVADTLDGLAEQASSYSDTIEQIVEKTTSKYDSLVITNNTYSERGSLNMQTGQPIDVDNRIRSGFIKPNSVPFTITAKSGYTFNFVTYDTSLNFASSGSNLVTQTFNSSERYIRIVIKPDSGTLDSYDITDYVTNDFTDCKIYGTLQALGDINNEFDNIDSQLTQIDSQLTQKLPWSVFDKIEQVVPTYSERGSLNMQTGQPTDVDNRIRSGFIKPDSVPFTITAKSGYTFNWITYDTSLNFVISASNETTKTFNSSERYIRIVIKPDSGTLTSDDITDYVTNDFTDCKVYGTLYELQKFSKEINESATKTNVKNTVNGLMPVRSTYSENGSISTSDGLPIDVDNRIRSGFIKPDSVPFTITAKSGYTFNLYSYNEDFSYIGVYSNQTSYTIIGDKTHFRIVIKPDSGTLDSYDITDYVTNDFTDCKVYGTLIDYDIIKKNLYDIQKKFSDFSLNVLASDNTSMVWEYQNWVFPQVVSYNKIRNRLYYTFTNKEGYSGIACYDYTNKAVTKTMLKLNSEADDHNLIAVLMMSNDKLLCSYSGGHNTDRNIYIRIASAKESIEKFEDAIVLTSNHLVSYSQLFEYDGKIYLFYRTGNTGWSYRISADYGLTWTDETNLIQTSIQYYCQFTETTTDGVLRLCCYSNPTAGDSAIRMGFLHLDNMTLYDTDNETVIGTSSIGKDDITVIIPITSGKVNRLFNALKSSIADTKVLYCIFTADQNDGEYYLYDNGTNIKIIDAGTALWIPKAQLGLAWVTSTQVVVGRGYMSQDWIELYDYTNGEFTLNKVIAHNARESHGTNYYRTARPMVDNNSKAVLYIQGYFDPGSFFNFTMDSHIYDLQNSELLV